MTIQGRKHTITIKVSIETMDLFERFIVKNNVDFNRSEYIENLLLEDICRKNKQNKKLSQ